MISLDLIRIHVKAPQGENGMLKYRQLPNSVIPADPSIIPTSHIPCCIPGTCKFLPVRLFYNSMILPSYRLLSQKPPHHFSSCRSTTPPPMNTFEISFTFVRQDKIETSPGQQIMACISNLLFPPLKVVFVLGQNLIEKPGIV